MFCWELVAFLIYFYALVAPTAFLKIWYVIATSRTGGIRADLLVRCIIVTFVETLLQYKTADL